MKPFFNHFLSAGAKLLRPAFWLTVDIRYLALKQLMTFCLFL